MSGQSSHPPHIRAPTTTSTPMSVPRTLTTRMETDEPAAMHIMGASLPPSSPPTDTPGPRTPALMHSLPSPAHVSTGRSSIVDEDIDMSWQFNDDQLNDNGWQFNEDDAHQAPESGPRQGASSDVHQASLDIIEKLAKTVPLVESIDKRLRRLEASQTQPTDRSRTSCASRGPADDDSYDDDADDEGQDIMTPKKNGPKHTNIENDYNICLLYSKALQAQRDDNMSKKERKKIDLHAPPSKPDLLAFKEGALTGPTYEDFSIVWVPSSLPRTAENKAFRAAANEWNDEAAAIFAQAFLDGVKAGNYYPIDEEWKTKWKTTAELQERFKKKLKNFDRVFLAAHMKASEMPEDDVLFAVRKATVSGSGKASREVRRAYLLVLQTLGAAGMTSDETDAENEEIKNPIEKVYLSKAIKELTCCCDRSHKGKDKLARDKRGTPLRKRGKPLLKTNTKAIPGLPLDFYSDSWLQGLSAVARRRLNIQPPMGLPPLTEF
ncbi:hypothetical protein M422DRAFT_776340 [Sphaerobolus stellatus SS14]|nr:hypothetical protein M422DRAFT_776340 [Sphaerobolus stellatus SS14]